MRRIAVTALALLTSLLWASGAMAQKPGAHIVGDLTITKNLAGLTVSGKGAGFGNLVTEAFLTAERIEAVFQCRNAGGNVAPGQGVELTDVVGPSEMIEPRSGRIIFSPTLPAPPAPDPADVCPNPNWTVEPVSLTFFGVELVFEQDGVEVLRVFVAEVIDP